MVVVLVLDFLGHDEFCGINPGVTIGDGSRQSLFHWMIYKKCRARVDGNDGRKTEAFLLAGTFIGAGRRSRNGTKYTVLPQGQSRSGMHRFLHADDDPGGESVTPVCIWFSRAGKFLLLPLSGRT